jgi:hypothetical protein
MIHCSRPTLFLNVTKILMTVERETVAVFVVIVKSGAQSVTKKNTLCG